jgi:hypothetical protein
MLLILRVAAVLLVVTAKAGAQAPPVRQFVPVGLFIASIEEGARIFTPVRLLPLMHPEALGHQFPTALQLHRGEYQLLLAIGQHAGLRLAATLQRYPTEPDTLWPYAPFAAPPVGSFDGVVPTVRPASKAPLPGLRAIAYVDRAPIAFIVDTRNLTLADRGMEHATTMGLDITRAQLLTALAAASESVPASGPAILIYTRATPSNTR